jgi:hypothetical protein
LGAFACAQQRLVNVPTVMPVTSMGAVFLLGRLVDHRPLGGMGLQTCAALRRFQSRLGSLGGFGIAVLRVAGAIPPCTGARCQDARHSPHRHSGESRQPNLCVIVVKQQRRLQQTLPASCAWGSPSRRGRGRKCLEERLRSKCRPQVNDDSGWLLKWVAPDVRDPGWNDHRFAGVCNPSRPWPV